VPKKEMKFRWKKSSAWPTIKLTHPLYPPPTSYKCWHTHKHPHPHTHLHTLTHTLKHGYHTYTLIHSLAFHIPYLCRLETCFFDYFFTCAQTKFRNRTFLHKNQWFTGRVATIKVMCVDLKQTNIKQKRC
jgi:hypothetical protein